LKQTKPGDEIENVTGEQGTHTIKCRVVEVTDSAISMEVIRSCHPDFDEGDKVWFDSYGDLHTEKDEDD